jgi:hypothetical protein
VQEPADVPVKALVIEKLGVGWSGAPWRIALATMPSGVATSRP